MAPRNPETWNSLKIPPQNLLQLMTKVVHALLVEHDMLPKLASSNAHIPQGRGVKQGSPFSPILFNIALEGIPALAWGQRYKYLGSPTGANRFTDISSLRTSLVNDANVVFQSPLAEWQKLDCFRKFLFPRVSFALRVVFPGPAWCKQLAFAFLSVHARSTSIFHRLLEVWGSRPLLMKLTWLEQVRRLNSLLTYETPSFEGVPLSLHAP